MLLVLLVPLLLAVGVAVDFARMVQFRTDLQNAVDEAALAGAAAFVESTQAAQASAVATNYLNRAMLPWNTSVTVNTLYANPSGSINAALGNAPAHTVTLTVTATVPTTLMSLVSPSSETIKVMATAANPVVSASLAFPAQLSSACDGNTAFLYQVPQNSSKTGYDYSSVPAPNSATTTNYYEIYTSYSPNSSLGQMPTQTLPTFSVNQPLGVMLRNDTNGNVGNSNCSVTVTGANSYGAPSGASQTFYSSLLMNGESPSELSNYTYTASVTTSYTTTTTTTSTRTSTKTGSTQVTDYTLSLPPNTLYPNGRTCTLESPCQSATPDWSQYDLSEQLSIIFGINAPGTANSACTAGKAVTTSVPGTPTTSNGRTMSSTTYTTVTPYTCKTQYRTSAQAYGNCSLYVQTGTGVTQSYLSGLSTSSTAPSAARGSCFNMTGGGAANSAPSCAQLSALASGTGTNAVAPAAVFWWDDAGGVGPNEPYYGPSAHCSQIGSSSAGYGEDCQYKNMVVALQCQATGGSGTGYTEVVLSK